MAAIRIRKTIDSETLTLPELKPLIGRTVEIVIEEQPAGVSSEEFWAYAGNLPTDEAEFAAQQEQFRRWRADPRYERYWPTLDWFLARDFEKTRKWAAVLAAVRELGETGYDFDAWKEQREFDARSAAGPPR